MDGSNQSDNEEISMDGFDVEDGVTASTSKNNNVLNTSDLIERIRINKLLWFLQDKDYKDGPKKETVWIKFSKDMGIPAPDLQHKWELLKGAYSREKCKRKTELSKSGGAGPARKKPRPGFAHFDAMQFLELNTEAKKKKTYTNKRVYGNQNFSKNNSSCVVETRMDSSSCSDESFRGEQLPESFSLDLDFGVPDQTFMTSSDNMIESLKSSLENELSVLEDCTSNISNNVIAQTPKHTNTVTSGKENTHPPLPSPWKVPKTTAEITKPVSCFNASVNKQSQGKKDPMVDTAIDLCKVLKESLEYESKLKEKNKDTPREIPLGDEFVGKTVAAELASIQDESIKQIKKSLIMSAVYFKVDPAKSYSIVASDEAANSAANTA